MAKKQPKNKDNISLIPLADRVIVQPEAAEVGKETRSGIFIPETVDKEKPSRGKVVAVGPGRRLDDGTIIPVSVKVGMKVVFSKYSPDEIKINDKEYYVIREENILAVIK